MHSQRILCCCLHESIAAANNKDDSDLTSPPESKPLSLLLVSGFQPGHIVPLVKFGHELVKRGHNVSDLLTRNGRQ